MGVKLDISHKRKNIDWKCFENRVLRRIFGTNREEVVDSR